MCSFAFVFLLYSEKVGAQSFSFLNQHNAQSTQWIIETQFTWDMFARFT